MTPKEKAKELFDKMYWHFRTVADADICKQCALIAVDEFIEYLRWTQDYHLANYWREVKQEIELL